MKADLKTSVELKNRKVFLQVLSLTLAVCTFLLLHEIILYSRNTPRIHPEWVLSKYLLMNPPFVDEGDNSRNLYSQNRLNLHEWHGFNEYLLDRIFQPGIIRFRFSLVSNSYLYVIFNKTKESFNGIRFSRNSQFPGICFRADRKGKFLERQMLQNISVSEGWHQVELTFNQAGVSFSFDKHAPQSFSNVAFQQQIMGFRCGKNGTMVDDVEV